MENPITPTHDPVMMAEVLADLAIQPGHLVVDGTLGLAGHAGEMLKAAQPGGHLIGFDWDATMLELAAQRLPEGVELVRADFRSIPEVLAGRRPNAILLDLGLNSFQIDDQERGISFLQEGQLDMRLDRSRGEPASSLLNRVSEDALEKILREYGGERWARRIAKIVLEHRKVKPLRTTTDLVNCVLAAIPAAMRETRIHPATRTFQAIRIAVSGELLDLERAVLEIADTLAVDGTLVVLSYHSGEDKPVKEAFRKLSQYGFEELHRKPLTPSEEEISRNRRSRSAKMRAIRRTKERVDHE